MSIFIKHIWNNSNIVYIPQRRTRSSADPYVDSRKTEHTYYTGSIMNQAANASYVDIHGLYNISSLDKTNENTITYFSLIYVFFSRNRLQ